MTYYECLDCAVLNRDCDGPKTRCMSCEMKARPKQKHEKQKKGQPPPVEPYGSHGISRKEEIGKDGYVRED